MQFPGNGIRQFKLYVNKQCKVAASPKPEFTTKRFLWLSLFELIFNKILLYYNYWDTALILLLKEPGKKRRDKSAFG